MTGERNASPLSVMARIRNQARAIGVDPAKLAQRYVFERFLLRLSLVPEWRERMVLKGANAMVALTRDLARTTEDLDMWTVDPLTRDEAISMFAAVAAAPTPDRDPIEFDVAGLRIAAIREASGVEEPGHQLVCTARIGQANIKFKLEISHYVPIAPAPIAMDYPTMFEGDVSPRIVAFHPSTMLSEKVHAMVRFGDRSTRMKDFYDVRALMTHVGFSGEDIVAAFRATFENCSDDLPDPARRLAVFDDGFAAKGERLWRAWADDKFGSVKNYRPEPFAAVAAEIEPFLMRCLAMARGEEGVQDWKDGVWSGPSSALGM